MVEAWVAGVAAACVVACVVMFVVWNVSGDNAAKTEHGRWRSGLAVDNATVRVCIRVSAHDSVVAAAEFVLCCLRTAVSPARLRFAVVTDGAKDGDFEGAYAQCARGVAARTLASQLRVFNVPHTISRGWLEAFEIWNDRLCGNESAVVVLDHLAFAPVEGWDKAVADLVRFDLPQSGIFTASGPSGNHFPALALGSVAHDSFPRLISRPFATLSANWSRAVAAPDLASSAQEDGSLPPPRLNLTPAVCVDKRCLVYAGRHSAAAARAVSGMCCSLAEADVALSAQLFERAGLRPFTREASDWIEEAPVGLRGGFGAGAGDDDEDELEQPAGATRNGWVQARGIRPDYAHYAGLRAVRKKSAVKGSEWLPDFSLTVSARLGLTVGAERRPELVQKYGSVTNFSAEHRALMLELHTRGFAIGDDNHAP